jgi:hypothetical protein
VANAAIAVDGLKPLQIALYLATEVSSMRSFKELIA